MLCIFEKRVVQGYVELFAVALLRSLVDIHAKKQF